MVKALALFSGGLDSALAAKLMLRLGIETEAAYFVNAFLPGNSNHQAQRCLAAELGLKLYILDISQLHLDLVQAPRYGYGENMNPSIDCRILMLQQAKAYMQKHGFSFLVSGEVLGQRPMSQRKDSFNIIDRDAQVKGLILRPLSAKRLPPTLAEEKGWVDRDRLLDFSGRSRKAQLALAKQWDVKGYLTPAGGCLLTEQEFSHRFRDLFEHGQCCLEDVQLLKLGRHFRYNRQARIIVGRNHQENERLAALASDGDILCKLHDCTGPLTLIRVAGSVSGSGLTEAAARLTARYSKARSEVALRVEWRRKGAPENKFIMVTPAEEALVEKMRI